MNKVKLLLAAAAITTIAGPACADVINGNFEASSSQTSTPPGWTNVGHMDGVIAYSAFGTPAYDGNYFYDLGGYGNASGPVGDGIQQAVATVLGQAYVLTFGLSSENASSPITQLTVSIGGLSTVYNLSGDGSGAFKKPFTTQTINYVATGSSTLISFIQTANASGGNNDALIDKVSFLSSATSAVPEPGTWAMMIGGFGLVGGALRRRRSVKVALAG